MPWSPSQLSEDLQNQMTILVGSAIRLLGGEFGGFLFPLGVEFGEAVLDVDEFAVELLGAAGGFVGFSFLEIGDEFGLTGFQILDFFFEFVDALLLGFAFARAGLALYGFEAVKFEAYDAVDDRHLFQSIAEICGHSQVSLRCNATAAPRPSFRDARKP